MPPPHFQFRREHEKAKVEICALRHLLHWKEWGALRINLIRNMSMCFRSNLLLPLLEFAQFINCRSSRSLLSRCDPTFSAQSLALLRNGYRYCKRKQDSAKPSWNDNQLEWTLFFDKIPEEILDYFLRFSSRLPHAVNWSKGAIVSR